MIRIQGPVMNIKYLVTYRTKTKSECLKNKDCIACNSHIIWQHSYNYFSNGRTGRAYVKPTVFSNLTIALLLRLF